MAISIGIQIPLLPLTIDVFGINETKVLIGAVTPYCWAIDVMEGWCLVVNRVLYIHPTLFDLLGENPEVDDAYNMHFCLENGIIKGRGWNTWDKCLVNDEVILQAPPAKLEMGYVDNVIRLVQALGRNNNICGNGTDCPDYECSLPPRRAILCYRYHYEYTPTALCEKCFEKLVQKDPSLTQRILLDGRRLPNQSPVPLWKG